MTKPTVDVNKPEDSDIIGLGAEAIRETRRQIYDLFPIGPDDLDYDDTSNWWPAGSLTGGFDPAVERGDAEPHPDMQDRYALVGQQVAVWDWAMPDNKNILTIGLDTGTAVIEAPDSTNWVNIETDDKVQPMRLHDLMDVYLGTVEPEDDDVLIYNDSMSQWVNRPRSSLAADGADGADGKGWTGTTVLQDDATTYIIRFDSAYPELVFDTVNLKGPAGADGTSAYQQWLDAGNTGTEQDFLDSLQGPSGADGADGADGDSAYQIAVDNGFQGTEQEWLDSLVGDEGPAGADGHGLNFQGEVADEASLPPTANEGDTYKTTDTGNLWVYTENGDWLDLGQVEGAPGEDGDSAYEVAVANGFVGDEAAWLASLAGADGVTPTIVAGTATKLDHQANPTVTLSALGNDTYQYDFGIPAGEPADPLDLEPLENAVSDLQTDVGNLESRVGQNELGISLIQAEQITQNNAIQSNQDKNTEQDLRLDDLESDVADNAAAIEVNSNAITDIQNIQGGSNTVPDPVKADDVLMSDGPDAYSWRTVDFAAIEDVRDKVYDHENQIHGNPDTLPDPTVGLIDRVTDLEAAVDGIAGTDPADHVTQEELDTVLYGTGTSPSDADDGVYSAIQANTDLIEDINTVKIPALDGRVTQNETDIAALQTSTGNNATAISDLEGRVTTNEGDIAQNTGDIQQNQTDIATNAGNIAQNTIDIGLLEGRVTVNEGDISTNATNISTNTSDITAIKTQLTPGSHETILTSVDNGDGTFSTTWAPNEHIDEELPDYSAADNGKVLEVNSSGDLVWAVPGSVEGGVGYNILDNSGFTINERLRLSTANSGYNSTDWHADRWKKGVLDPRDIWQGIHENDFLPNSQYTLSYTDNSGTRVSNSLTSPSSGNWQVSIPDTATKPKLELGATATEWIPKPYAAEVAACAKYFRVIAEKMRQSGGPITMGGTYWSVGWSDYFDPMMAAPALVGQAGLDLRYSWSPSGGLDYQKPAITDPAAIAFSSQKDAYTIRLATEYANSFKQNKGENPVACYFAVPMGLDSESGYTTGVASSAVDFDASYISSITKFETSEADDVDDYDVTTSDGYSYRFSLSGSLSPFVQRISDLISDGSLTPVVVPAYAKTKQDFYRQAIQEMNSVLEATDKFILRNEEYKKVLPPTITGNGNVNAFTFNLSDLGDRVKGWREDVIQTTVARMKEIKAGANEADWIAALDNNVFAVPVEDMLEVIESQINDMGDFRNTSDTSEWGAVPVVNSVYQYRLEMIGIVTQELNEFWNGENANSTMYREAERIRIGNSNSSYMHEQIIGNPQYETWYKHVVNQFSDKMQAIYDASTYEEADTAFATAINYDGPYAADQRPMPITWTDKTVGWGRRTAESTDPYNALQSARAKLVALGLTDQEALALSYYEGDNSRMLSEW